jgi:NitT/TauT family transport system substrate-binding protein
MFVGQEKGFFKAAGLDVAITPGAGTGNNLKLLGGGAADFVVVDLSGAILQYYGKTPVRDWKVVSAIYQLPVSCIIALKDSGIKQPRDLENKRIAYTAGGVNFTLFPVYAKAAGIDASKIKWVQMPPNLFESSLKAHKVDAITEIVVSRPSIEADFRDQAAAGDEPVVEKTVMFPYSDRLSDEFSNAIAVSGKTASDNPDLVRRFNKAVFQSWKYTIEHPDEAAAIFSKRYPAYSVKVAAAEIVLLGSYMNPPGGAPLGSLTPDRVAKNIAALQGLGGIPGGTNDPNQYVSFDLVPKS